MIFSAQHGSLSVTTGKDYYTQQIPIRMWGFPVSEGAWINPEVCFPFLLTTERILWGSDSMWNAQPGRFTSRALWSLSRKDKSVRMMFLCKQLAQRGNLALGRKLENGGSENLPGCSFPHAHTHPGETETFWAYKPNGAEMPPYKDPRLAEEFPGSRVVTSMDPLWSSSSAKGLQHWQEMDSDFKESSQN